LHVGGHGKLLPCRHGAKSGLKEASSCEHRRHETDLPVKGQFFHREAENRLFCRLRDAKKNSILNEFKMNLK
jgi:hypothetical protein